MDRLRQSDCRLILDFLSTVYLPTVLGDFRERLVDALAGLIPSEWAYCGEMSAARHTSVDLASPRGSFPPDISRRLWQPLMHEHPVLMHCQRTGDLHAYRISDFYSQGKFQGLAIYNEFYKKIGIKDTLSKGIQVSGPVVIGCSFQRSRRSFTDRELLIFDLIGPHVVQAWRNSRALTRLQQEMRLIGRTLDRLDRGIVIAEHSGRVRMMTPRARRLLVQCFGRFQEEGGGLPQPLRLWLRHQLSLVDSVDSLQPRVPLLIEREEGQIEIRLITNSGRNLLLIEEHRNSADPKALLRLGLTQREAEVLAWVAEGKTNTEIATILAVSPRTVQKHMEHLMAKLGVETRTAAARVAHQALTAS